MKQHLYMYISMPGAEKKKWREEEAKLDVMQATYLTIRLCPTINQDAFLQGSQTFQTLFKTFFDGNTDSFQLSTTKDHAELGEVLKVVLGVLNPSQSCQASLQQCNITIQAVLDGLLLHYCSSHRMTHHQEDMLWFMELANRQIQWKQVLLEDIRDKESGIDEVENCSSQEEQVQVPSGVLVLNRFKYHLSCILGYYKEDAGSTSNVDKLQSGSVPQGMYEPNVRALIGSVLCPQDSHEDPPVPYIPLFYQYSPGITAGKYTESKLMQQPLCHLYFLTVLDHLLGKQRSKNSLQHLHSHLAGVIRMANSIKTSLETAVGGEAVLLQVELQAVTQVLIQQVALHLSPKHNEKLVYIIDMANEINLLLDEQRLGCVNSHGMVLSLYLLKMLKSLRQFSDLMTTKRDLLRHINCLKPIYSEYNATLKIKPHLFSFLQSGCDDKLAVLYTDLTTTMMGINKDSKKVADLISIAQTCCTESRNSGNDGCFTFRMVLWMVTYYEFFDKKVVSEKLCNMMRDQELATYLRDNGCICLLQCFLFPNHMIQTKEVPNTFTTEQLDHMNPEEREQSLNMDSKKIDPIYSFFMPEKPDQSDIDLRHELANLVAVVLGSPTHCSHLWYHLFAADKLENTYVTGFMYNNVVKQDDYLQYGYGTELSLEGQFAHKDYAQHACRGTYTLHSLYLLLWANFGAFCMALLTQPGKEDPIHSIVISKTIPIRHYCISQVKALWKHMCSSIGLSEEKRAFFVTQALHRLYKVQMEFHKDFLDKQGERNIFRGVFETQEHLDFYEKWWHVNVYQPTWDQLSERFTELCNQQESQLFANLQKLEVQYPHFPTMQEFTHCILGSGTLQQLSNGGSLFILYNTAMDWKHLHCGGLLLPDLIEFYQWLHTNISHLVTVEHAAIITIGRVIEIARQNLTKDFAEYLNDLYKRVKTRYNEYVRVIGVIGGKACGTNYQSRKIFTIEDDIPLLDFLSDMEEERQGSDCLFTVMSNIIANHNQTIKNLYSSIRKHQMVHFLPGNPPEIHSNEISLNTAIVGQFQNHHGVNKFLQLLRSFYQPSLSEDKSIPTDSILISLSYEPSAIFQTSHDVPIYNMEQLEENIMDEFIAGKPIITSYNSLRTVFKFKEKSTEMAGTSLDVEFMVLEIQHMGEKLPDDFKVSMSADYLKRLEYEFHSASYHLLNEVVMGLQTVIGHLTKALSELPNHDDKELKEQFVTHFMLNLYDGLSRHSEVLQKIGIYSARRSHMLCLGDLPLICVYDCLKLFFMWVEEGYYDFNALPFPLKVHMTDQDQVLIEQKIRSHWTGSINDLSEKLQDLIDVLKHLEQDITKKVKEAASTPILDYLMQYPKFNEEKGHITQYLSRSILLQHYVAFRLSLRKLFLKICQELQGKKDGQGARDIWLEFDSELWGKHLPHLRKGIYGKGRIVFDPKTKHYGFQEDSEEGDVSENALEVALLQDAQENEKDVCKPLQIPEPLESTSGSAITASTPKFSSSSDEEKAEEIDGERQDTSKHDAASTQNAEESRDSASISLEELAKSKTPSEVIAFLVRISQTDYIDSFEENEVNGLLLLKAEKEDFEDLRVKDPFHQERILELFRQELAGVEVKYSNDYLKEFLHNSKLEKYSSLLEKHMIDSELLLTMDDKAMKEILKEKIGMKAIEAKKLIVNFRTYVEEKST